MSVKSRGIMIIALLLLAACTLPWNQADPATEPAPADPNAVALAAAQAHLEEHLGRELTGIQVAYGPAEWTDTSLNCPQDGAQAEPATIPGFQIEMTVDGTMYELHTNADGTVVVLCPERQAESPVEETVVSLPAEVDKPLEKAKTLLAEALGESPESIEPHDLSWEAMTFPNSGLGCPEPDTVYAEVLTEGYSFSFTHQGNQYEIHTDLTGDSGVVCMERVAPAETPPGDTPDAVQEPLDTAQALLADELGVSQDSLTPDEISWEQLTFPNGALGCPKPGVAYTEAEVEGYIFTLSYAGTVYQVHTDLAGEGGVVCEILAGGGPVTSTPPDKPANMIFSSFSDSTLGIGISYPLGWTIEPGQAEGEIYLGPAGDDSTHGMLITLLGDLPGDVEAWMSEYQITLYNSDPTALQSGERQVVGTGGQSQLFSRTSDGVPIMERVTFFPEGYRVLQWGPEAEWETWDDPYLQMLDSLTFIAASEE